MKIKKVYLFIFCFLAIGLVAVYFVRAQSITKIDLISTQEENNQNQAHATFGAVGDIMLSRNVASKINKAKNPLLPFSKLSAILKTNDFNFANLESPFSGKDNFNPSPSMVFNAPRANIKGLVENKFTIVSLANNHMLDQRVSGLENTLSYLNKNNIQTSGAGKNLDDAWQEKIVTANGIKIGFISVSYTSNNDNGKTNNQYVARWEDKNRLQQAINNLRQSADFVVVSMHAGTEYKYQPTEVQKNFARLAIDLGADLIIGSHPHSVQTIEKYKDKYIFYSLGNFIFDQEWSQQTKEGLMLKIAIAKNDFEPAHLDQIELMPIVIENYSTPRLATEKEVNMILNHIGVKNRVLR